MYSFPYWEAVCCSMSGSNCCLLSRIQVFQETGQVVWYSHLFQNFPQFLVIHTVKSFIIVNEAEVYVFLEFPCFFYDPVGVGSLISGSSAFSKSGLYIWKFLVHVLLKPSLKDLNIYFFSGIPLLFLWSSGCWKFELWFLCLLQVQLEHQVLS